MDIEEDKTIILSPKFVYHNNNIVKTQITKFYKTNKSINQANSAISLRFAYGSSAIEIPTQLLKRVLICNSISLSIFGRVRLTT